MRDRLTVDHLEAVSVPTVLVIFGATGDLTRRKLVPALFHLYKNDSLSPLMRIVGFARSSLSDQEFRQIVKDICTEQKLGEEDEIAAFSELFSYRSGLFENIDGYKDLASLLGRQDEKWHVCANKLLYLAVPPQYYETILNNISLSHLSEPCGPDGGWTRVLVEKPFGKDLRTAQKLDALLGELFEEEQVYRVDHYLGKETVQNILAFRFSNNFLEPAWNNKSVEKIEIKLLEEEGINGRAGFYEGLGALRDVGQNHLLQLLALFAMERPDDLSADSIRYGRKKVLESLTPIDGDLPARYTVRGQYEGYTDLDGVDDKSITETYFKVKAELGSSGWKGVPIYLESGKKTGESLVEVKVTFRHKVPCLCPPDKHVKNMLSYRVQPREGADISFWVKKPGTDMVIEEKDFTFNYQEAYEDTEFIDAYAKLLLDAIRGDQTLFVSTDEILASWRFVDPIIQAWQADKVPLQTYKADTASLPLPGESDRRKKEIAFIGLGKMGSGMARRLLNHNWQVAACDPGQEARDEAARDGVRVTEDAVSLVNKLKPPRLIWLMIPHQVVDKALEEIRPHLKKGDIVIDGGNSFYKDTVRRAEMLAEDGVHYMDAGVSGGPEGARRGSCLMVGGDKNVYENYKELFEDLAVPGGHGYMGKSGAGHFVKMVHNGIEYGMMQAIAEGFEVMKKSEFELDVDRIAELYGHGSVIESRLVGWLKDAYDQYGSDLDKISGRVEHSGAGLWTVKTAKEMGIPVPIIEGALQFREDSQTNPSYTGQIVSALRNQFGGHEVKKKNNSRQN